MKNILLWLLLTCGMLACKDDGAVFDASIPRENIKFESIPGGAIMRYVLPEDTDIFAVRAEYKDYKGKQMVKIASYTYDSLVLDGFNTRQENVPVRVSLLNQANEESKAMEFTFNTEDSAPVAFFNNIEVKPYWNGFQIKYKVPKGADLGLCDVFFMGTNPMTQELDTLLLETFAIETGENVKYFSLEQIRDQNTIIIKTEDKRGNIAMEKTYPDIASLNVGKLDPARFELLDPFNLSKEDDDLKLGWKYLFDGDTKGSKKWYEYGDAGMKMYSFLAGPWAVSTPEKPKYFILDIKKEQQVASFKMYAMLYLRWPTQPLEYRYSYGNKLPNKVTVYASNDEGNDKKWIQVGQFYQSRTAAVPWAQRAFGVNYAFQLKSDVTFEAAEPCFFTISFSEENPAYRFFKIEFNETFNTIIPNYGNELEYVTLHEIEIYGK